MLINILQIHKIVKIKYCKYNFMGPLTLCIVLLPILKIKQVRYKIKVVIYYMEVVRANMTKYSASCPHIVTSHVIVISLMYVMPL